MLLRAAIFLAFTFSLTVVASWAPVSALYHPALALAGLLLTTRLLLRRDGEMPGTLGLDFSWHSLALLVAGLAGGALLIVAIAGCLRSLLPFPWRWNPSFSIAAVGGSLVFYFFSNSCEELVFRGYSFDCLLRALGHWPAQLVTALLFALFHIANGWPWQVALIGTTLGSFLFGLTFVRWRSVPAAAGVHIAVNWTRDLLLLDPPETKTLYAPLSPRAWSQLERLTGTLIFVVVTLLACAVLALSLKKRQLHGLSPRGAMDTPGRRLPVILLLLAVLACAGYRRRTYTKAIITYGPANYAQAELAVRSVLPKDDRSVTLRRISKAELFQIRVYGEDPGRAATRANELVAIVVNKVGSGANVLQRAEPTPR